MELLNLSSNLSWFKIKRLVFGTSMTKSRSPTSTSSTIETKHQHLKAVILHPSPTALMFLWSCSDTTFKTSTTTATSKCTTVQTIHRAMMTPTRLLSGLPLTSRAWSWRTSKNKRGMRPLSTSTHRAMDRLREPLTTLLPIGFANQLSMQSSINREHTP